MQPEAAIANMLWTASNAPAYWRFRKALANPGAVQHRKLIELLRQNAQTEFGKAHKFEKIHSYEEYAKRVPLSDYIAFEPWIAPIRQGRGQVLTRERVTRLVPTSGSTGGRKLIPFTAGLQREFNEAIGAWLVDLAWQSPGILGGPAYWSITPALSKAADEESIVPIGFDADTAYLGGKRRQLAEAIMAVPESVTRTNSSEEFRYRTLLHLLLCRDLRLISVWHPSFLMLLLDALTGFWDRLLNDIERGTACTPAHVRRARELRGADPMRPETLWPSLRLISCWGRGAAEPPMENLRRLFGNVSVQPKGLIATEAFVTLPFQGRYPLAVNSHFFEFIDERGRARTVEELESDNEYEMVVTTAGGLWRYKLGDRVRVSGYVQRTPSLKFLGRSGNVSDRFGEKLSERFVADVLHEIFGTKAPRFALLAPDEDERGWRYTLYVEGELPADCTVTLDRALRRNPHYDYCRDLGQLSQASIFVISQKAYEAFARRQAANGARLGDIKALSLSRLAGWSQVFEGDYWPNQHNTPFAALAVSAKPEQ